MTLGRKTSMEGVAEETGIAPADLVRHKVNECPVYLCILGMRYGYVGPGTGLSMTELEYRQAIASDKRVSIFVMDENAPILANMVEDGVSRLDDNRSS